MEEEVKDKDLNAELDEEVETDKDLSEDNDEFDYDEDGNIIIPDVADEDEQEEDIEEEQDENKDEDENEGSEESKEVVEPVETKTDERDEKLAKLEAELAALKLQGKDTLSKLGVESDNVLEGLEKLAAEAEDVPLDEYRQKKAQDERNNAALQMLQRTEFEKKMKLDFAELQAAYPETKRFSSIVEIENFAKFGKFRDLGLSPKEAYAAANPDSVRQNVANAVKQKSLNNKEHLQSAVPKASKDNSITMPKSDLVAWRELFPSKSDKEIIELYKKSL